MVYVLGSCAFIVGDLLAWGRHSFYCQGGAEFADLGRTLIADHNAKEIIMLVSKAGLWKLFVLVLLLVIFTTKFVSCWFFTFVMTLCRVGLKSPMLECEDSLQTTRTTFSWRALDFLVLLSLFARSVNGYNGMAITSLNFILFTNLLISFQYIKFFCFHGIQRYISNVILSWKY